MDAWKFLKNQKHYEIFDYKLSVLSKISVYCIFYMYIVYILYYVHNSFIALHSFSLIILDI